MPSGIIINIQGDGTGAAEALRMIEEKMKETAEVGTSMSEELKIAGERIERALEFTGIYFGIHEVIDGLKELLKGSVELGMEIGHLAQQTGVSAENLSVLKYASEQTGVSFEAIAKGFGRLQKSLLQYQEGSKETVDALKLLNISQKEMNETGGDTWKVFELIADRMSGMPDGWQKTAAAMTLFSRGGQALIPLLNQGSAALEQYSADAASLGLVLNEKTVAEMERMYQTSQKLHAANEGIALQLETGLAPTLSSVDDALLKNNGDVSGWIQLGALAGNITKGFVAAMDALGAALETVGQEIMDTSELLVRFSKVALDVADKDFAAAWNDGSDAIHRYMQEQGEVRDEWKGLASDMKNLWSQASPAAGHSRAPGGEPGAPQLASKDSADKIAKAIREREDKLQKEIAEAQQRADAASLRMQKALIEQEEAEAKSGAQEQLAVLDAQHSAGLVADQDFYARKLQLREDELDAEQKAIQQQQAALRSARANSAEGSKEQADIDTELVALETKLVELADRRHAIEEQTAIQMRVSRDIPGGGTSIYAARQHDEFAASADHAQMASATIGRMLDQIANMRGKDPLRELVDSMVQDLERLAVKVMEEQWIIPMMRSIFAPNLPNVMSGSFDPLGLNAPTMDLSGMAAGIGLSGLDHLASGGPIDAPALVGEEGPEIFAPSGPGTILPHDVLDGLAKSGGGGAPSVTINNTNNSSQPVVMRQTGVSYDSELKEFVIHTALEDMTQGGPLAQAMRGFGG